MVKQNKLKQNPRKQVKQYAYPRITQVLPAEGWSAVYAKAEDPFYFQERIACWTLTEEIDEDDGKIITSVKGQTPGDFVMESEEADNFLFYIHADDVCLQGTEIFQRAREAGKAWAEKIKRKGHPDLPEIPAQVVEV